MKTVFYAISAGMRENRINHNIYRNMDGIAQWHGYAIKHLLVIIFIDTLGSNDHMWKMNDDTNMQRTWELQRAQSYTIFWLLVPIENHNNYCGLTAANFHSYNNYSHCEMSTWNVWIWWINFAYYSNRANDWLALALGFATKSVCVCVFHRRNLFTRWNDIQWSERAHKLCTSFFFCVSFSFLLYNCLAAHENNLERNKWFFFFRCCCWCLLFFFFFTLL